MRRAVLVIAAGVIAAGCRNPCQEICVRLADYAEECGFTVPEAELDACLQDQSSGLEKGDREACRDFGTSESIRNEWSCDELARYWGTDGDGGDAR